VDARVCVVPRLSASAVPFTVSAGSAVVAGSPRLRASTTDSITRPSVDVIPAPSATTQSSRQNHDFLAASVAPYAWKSNPTALYSPPSVAPPTHGSPVVVAWP